MGLARGVARQTIKVLEELKAGKLVAQADRLVTVLQAGAPLRHFLPLTEKVLAQARARLFEGQTHYPDKVRSLLEEHPVVIRKGKAHQPNEFGRWVRIDEVENGIVGHYHIAANNRADQPQGKP